MKPVMNLRRIAAMFTVFAIGTAIAGAAVLRVVFKNHRPEKIIVERRLTDRDNPYSKYFFRDTAAVADSVKTFRFNISQPYEVSVRDAASNLAGSRWMPMGPDDEITLTVDSLMNKGRYSGTPLTDSLRSFARQEAEFMKLHNASAADFKSLMAIRDRFLGQFAVANSDNPVAVIALSYTSDSVKAAYFDLLNPDLEKSVVANEYLHLRSQVRDLRAITDARSSMTVGKVMPDFALPDSTGQIVRLSSMRGEWVLIDFWATWCAVCIRGFADLREFSTECGSRCKVVTIDIDDHEPIWRSFMSRHDMPWINLLNDPTDHTNSNPMAALGIDAIPVTVLIDPEGKIAAIQRGAKPGFLDEVKRIAGIAQPAESPL